MLNTQSFLVSPDGGPKLEEQQGLSAAIAALQASDSPNRFYSPDEYAEIVKKQRQDNSLGNRIVQGVQGVTGSASNVPNANAGVLGPSGIMFTGGRPFKTSRDAAALQSIGGFIGSLVNEIISGYSGGGMMGGGGGGGMQSNGSASTSQEGVIGNIASMVAAI